MIFLLLKLSSLSCMLFFKLRFKRLKLCIKLLIFLLLFLL